MLPSASFPAPGEFAVHLARSNLTPLQQQQQPQAGRAAVSKRSRFRAQIRLKLCCPAPSERKLALHQASGQLVQQQRPDWLSASGEEAVCSEALLPSLLHELAHLHLELKARLEAGTAGGDGNSKAHKLQPEISKGKDKQVQRRKSGLANRRQAGQQAAVTATGGDQAKQGGRVRTHGADFWEAFTLFLREAERLGLFALPPKKGKYSRPVLKRFLEIDTRSAPRSQLGTSVLCSSHRIFMQVGERTAGPTHLVSAPALYRSYIDI